jgi:hypothetical protein
MILENPDVIQFNTQPSNDPVVHTSRVMTLPCYLVFAVNRDGHHFALGTHKVVDQFGLGFQFI